RDQVNFMKHYTASWSRLLVGSSSFLTILCFGIALITAWNSQGIKSWFALLPVVVPLACALFTIRGYDLTPDEVLVQRLFWSPHLPRAGMQSAEVAPNAMRGSIRTFGNGGFFSFSGR